MNTKNRPSDWQRDPSRIRTATVQYWREGTMLTAMMPQNVAQELVRGGKAFVITSQAIGSLLNGEFNS
jgi:hypothetical protein